MNLNKSLLEFRFKKLCNEDSNSKLTKKSRPPRNRNVRNSVAIFCDVISTKRYDNNNILTRVSIVSNSSKLLLDCFVQPEKNLVSPKLKINRSIQVAVKHGEEFVVVQKKVAKILEGKILVGHNIERSLSSLKITHPHENRRDTTNYEPLCQLLSKGDPLSLIHILKVMLGEAAVKDLDNSVLKAKAIMDVYNRLSHNWELHMKNHAQKDMQIIPVEEKIDNEEKHDDDTSASNNTDNLKEFKNVQKVENVQIPPVEEKIDNEEKDDDDTSVSNKADDLKEFKNVQKAENDDSQEKEDNLCNINGLFAEVAINPEKSGNRYSASHANYHKFLQLPQHKQNECIFSFNLDRLFFDIFGFSQKDASDIPSNKTATDVNADADISNRNQNFHTSKNNTLYGTESSGSVPKHQSIRRPRYAENITSADGRYDAMSRTSVSNNVPELQAEEFMNSQKKENNISTHNIAAASSESNNYDFKRQYDQRHSGSYYETEHTFFETKSSSHRPRVQSETRARHDENEQFRDLPINTSNRYRDTYDKDRLNWKKDDFNRQYKCIISVGRNHLKRYYVSDPNPLYQSGRRPINPKNNTSGVISATAVSNSKLQTGSSVNSRKKDKCSASSFFRSGRRPINPENNTSGVISATAVSNSKLQSGNSVNSLKKDKNGSSTTDNNEIDINLTRPCRTPQAQKRDVRSHLRERYEIPCTEILLIKKLGCGHFSEVYFGKWRNNEVAVKVLPEGYTSKESIWRQFDTMKKYFHNRLIALYALSTQQEGSIYIVEEYMPKGNLSDFLSKGAGRFLYFENLIEIVKQVSSGMKYLESKKLVHGNLAARNVLVGENNMVKICDFGFARAIVDIYRSPAVDPRFPVKWTAPEAIIYNKYFIESDVWSYGIMLMEIFTYGREPYTDMNNYEIIKFIKSGFRMPKPTQHFLPENIYHLLLQCWNIVPEQRPTFKFLNDYFEDYLQIK